MERLVLKYTVSDGMTYANDVVLPITYDSAEKLAVDIEEQVKAGYAAKKNEITIGGHELCPCDFYYEGVFYAPSILTLDEWFA